MEEISTDILVIGSGLAGMTAALEAERSGLQVLLVGKFAIGLGTNTSLANGLFTVSNSLFSKDRHLKATLDAGRGLNCSRMVNTLIEKGPEAMEELKGYGVPLVEREIGYRVDRPEGSSQLPGVLLIKFLLDKLKTTSIRLLPGWVMFDPIVEDGEARGGFGFLRDGRPCLIRAKSVILATGGAGALYRRNDNQRTILGDGYAIALRAGLALFDLEFVQFFPFALAEPGLSTFMLFPPYPREIRLFNHKGEDLLEKLGIGTDFNRMISSQRDRLSIALYEETQAGDVYFDLTRIPAEAWERYPLSFLRKPRFPFHEKPFLIAPAVHFCMGGVEIDENGKTALPGLFAAGEVAWGVHGANRHGGNALTECAVFGTAAGQSAAEYARRKGQSGQGAVSEVLNRRWEKRARDYLKKKKKKKEIFDHPRDLLNELRDLAWKCAGPVREEDSMKQGLARLDLLEERIKKVYPVSPIDLFKKRDLENTALLLRVILKGSILRTESRGSFSRRDFPQPQQLPEPDDRHWLKNTCARLEKGEIQITHRPV